MSIIDLENLKNYINSVKSSKYKLEFTLNNNLIITLKEKEKDINFKAVQKLMYEKNPKDLYELKINLLDLYDLSSVNSGLFQIFFNYKGNINLKYY